LFTNSAMTICRDVRDHADLNTRLHRALCHLWYRFRHDQATFHRYGHLVLLGTIRCRWHTSANRWRQWWIYQGNNNKIIKIPQLLDSSFAAVDSSSTPPFVAFNLDSISASFWRSKTSRSCSQKKQLMYVQPEVAILRANINFFVFCFSCHECLVMRRLEPSLHAQEMVIVTG
jgi:hypothetical protein